MKAIKSDQIKLLERRRDFLQKRVEERGKAKGGDYDLAEISALELAIEYLEFIKSHDEVRQKIRLVESFEAITSLADEMD